MRWFVVVTVALAGCNRIFGLTDNVHERVFDAPIDAAPRCPGPTEPAPVYSTQLHDVIPQNCSDYTTSTIADLGFATCEFEGPSQGVVDGALAPIAMMPTLSGGGIYQPRLAPEGDEVFVEQAALSTVIYSRYVPVTGGWTWAADLTIALPIGTTISTPTSRTTGRRMLAFTFSTIDEWRDDGNDSWSPVASYLPADLGLSYIATPGLTEDGLAMVFYGSDLDHKEGMFYAARDHIEARFTSAQRISTPPVDKPVFITADCGRIYFSGVSHIFFAQQL